MATIQDYLNQIKNAIYGKDVRQAIHDGIQQCYYDGKAGSTDLEARQRLDTAEGSISSLGSRMSTAETDIDVLDSRVDQIVAPSGEAPSAAEVSDARVGADGTIYTNLGDAVRGQISNLKNDLNSIGSVEIKQPTYIGKYIALNGGVGSVVDTDNPTTYASFDSYVISCNEGDAFTLDIVGGTTPRAYAWLDSSKKIIYARGANNPVDETIVAPANTAYLVINDNSNGIVYKGEPLEDRLNALKNVAETRAISTGTSKVLNVNNVFNLSVATIGKYLSFDGYTEITSANYGYSDFIYIKDAEIVSFTGGSASNMMALYDINKNFIEADAISEFVNVELSDKVAYCRFNFSLSVANNIAMGIKILTNTIYKGQVEGLTDPIIIKVGANETYTTLKAAVDYADTISFNQAVEIHLAEGTYNALDGFDLSTQTASFTGLELPNNVSIIGDGDKDDIIIYAELPVDISAYSFARNNISTLNFWKNNSLKNVTVKAKNMRYAIHNDDYKVNAVEDAVENFEDCAFIYEALTSGVDQSTVSKVPFGTGMAKGRKMSFKRCLFQTDEATSKFASLFHNNTEQTKPCTVEFESCKFVGGWGGSVKVSSAGSGVTDVMEFKGCKGEKIRFTKESVYTGTSSEFKLYGYGNSFTGYVYEGITENANDTEMML